MKCPFCAETVQDEAKKCRFCGELITESAKKGYPAFYIQASRTGLTPDSLDRDYSWHLHPDEGFETFGCKGAIPQIFAQITGGADADDYYAIQQRKEIREYIDVVYKRLEEPDIGADEAKILGALGRYLICCNDTITSRLMGTAGDLRSCFQKLKELEHHAGSFDPTVRHDWEEVFSEAVGAYKNAIATSPLLQPEGLADARKPSLQGCSTLGLAVLIVAWEACRYIVK